MAALAALALTALPAVSMAQAPAPAPAAPAAINPYALGISLDRINRRLQADATAEAQGDSPLKLTYFLDVYGTAPTLRFFDGQDLRYGAVPGGAPTHADMLYQLTPQYFRSPRVDLFGLAVGAATAGAKKVQDWRYLRDLAAYQKMVEAGRNVPAPQPPRK